ncbi:IclR family transcriptional regulator domain-containing protein [Nonomuraea insulae]|uniref:IclR family transcriptional regulator C-terminal domain-containing protein n=1 Tax=Nonomuraea insulae TaxID=1616787 RepID=A0ABW1D5N6_9ACTN
MLLACLPRAEAGPVLARAGEPLTDESFLDRLAAIRDRGQDRAFNETIKGVSALAVPVYDASSRVAAALSVSGPSGRMSEEEMDRIEGDVLRAAQLIGRSLGA